MPSGAVICVFLENSLRYFVELVPRTDTMLLRGKNKVTVLLFKCEPQN